MSRSTHPHHEDHPVANIQADKVYHEALYQAASSIGDILARHCGPFAANAVIPTSITTTGMEDKIDRFTKDGISIAKLMRSTDPMTTYLSRLVTHIGESVDKSCHDGTTTSMYFFVQIVERIAELYKNSDVIDAPARLIIAKEVKEIIAAMRDVVEKNGMQIEDILAVCQTKNPSTTIDQVRYALAYHEAYIASKGDVELSDGIARVVASMPKEMFGYYEIEQTPIEMDKQYDVTLRQYDIGFTSSCAPAFYNAKLGTELIYDKADILVSEMQLDTMSPLSCFMVALMICDEGVRKALDNNRLESLEERLDFRPDTYGLKVGKKYLTKPTGIVTPVLASDRVFNDVRAVWNQLHPDRPIFEVTMPTSALVRQSYAHGINAMAGTKPLELTINKNPISSIIKNARVHLRGHFLSLGNLYKKTGEAFHPSYLNPKANVFYTETLKDIYDNIQSDKANHVRKFHEADLKALIGLYRSMTCQQIYDLRVGGLTHETVANRDVVVDAYGAALSAVSDGIIFGGYPKLWKWLTEQTAKLGNRASIKMAVYKLFTYAVRSVCGTIYANPCTVGRKIEEWVLESPSAGDPTVYFMPVNDPGTEAFTIRRYNFKRNVKDFLYPASIKDLPDEERLALLKKFDGGILVQPLVGYREQLKRYRAILPNLVNSVAFVDTTNHAEYCS